MNRLKVRNLIEAGALQINDGYRAKNEELGRPGLPFARAANIDGELVLDEEAVDCLAMENVTRAGSKVSRANDVVLTTKGSVGRVAFVRKSSPKFVYSPQLSFWRVMNSSLVNPRYLYFWMQGKEARDQLMALKGQTDMADYVSLVDQRSMTLTLPPIAEQEAVASLLGTLEDKIEANLRLAYALDRARQVSWQATFGSNQEDTAKHSWPTLKLSALCSTQYGYTASANTTPVGPHLVRVKDINKHPWIDWAEVPFCLIDGTDLPRYALSPGDLIIARMADPGKAAIIDDKVNAVFASYLVRLKTKTLAFAYFVYGYLRSPDYADYAAGAIGGSVQKSMNAKVLVDCWIKAPPQELVERHLDFAKPTRLRMSAALREVALLRRMRALLLPKLISGEIPVDGAARKIDSAL